MKSKMLILALFGLSIAITGCGTAISQSLPEDTAIAAQSDDAAKTITSVSQDGKVQITTPDTWQADSVSAADVEQGTILKLRQKTNEMEIAVLASAKVEGMGIDLFADAVELAAEAMVGPDGAVTPTSLTSINGLPGQQYEGRGELAGQALGVLATGLDSPDTYYTILVIGYESDFDETRSEIDAIVQSFQPAS